MKRSTVIPTPEEIAAICARKGTQSKEDAINSIRVQNGLSKLKPTHFHDCTGVMVSEGKQTIGKITAPERLG